MLAAAVGIKDCAMNIHSCPKALDVLAARNGNSLIKIQHFVIGVNPVASTVL